MSKFTHSGILVGDARSGGKTPTVHLRQTKNFWVDSAGNKYRKKSGYMTGGTWSPWLLKLESIKPLEESTE